MAGLLRVEIAGAPPFYEIKYRQYKMILRPFSWCVETEAVFVHPHLHPHHPRQDLRHHPHPPVLF